MPGVSRTTFKQPLAMNQQMPSLPSSSFSSSPSRPASVRKGFFSPKIVRAVSFYIITLCLALSVFVCILAIWDFARDQVWCRLTASCLVVAFGTGLFSFVNSIFGEPADGDGSCGSSSR